MGCGCTKAKGIKSYTVKRPGQPDKTVTSEAQAVALVRGVPGAIYRPVKA